MSFIGSNVLEESKLKSIAHADVTDNLDLRALPERNLTFKYQLVKR